MRKTKIAFHTLGCKTNQYETDMIAGIFVERGFEQVSFSGQADVYLINTCTVTGEADRKSRQILRRAKQTNPQALVVAMGCHAELADASAYADLCIGTQGKSEVINLVEQALLKQVKQSKKPNQTQHESQVSQINTSISKAEGKNQTHKRVLVAQGHSYDTKQEYEELGVYTNRSETRAYLKIVDGCNAFCSYCAIPLARGPVRSRDYQQIIREAKSLIAAGFKEIVLTGIHLCSYGSDRRETSLALAFLARDLAGLNAGVRIRLGSLEPRSVTSSFLEILEDAANFCPHFHLSLQSGSNRILKKMRRRYNTDDFREVVANIRKRWPLAGITTDVIVGFPTETDEDFELSLSFCREMAFTRMHIFRYSPRENTKAASLKPQVPAAVSLKRAQQMQAIAKEQTQEYHRLLFESKQTITVLTEQVQADGSVNGYAENYAPVLIRGLFMPTSNQLVRVQIAAYDEAYLYGKAIKEP